MSFTADNRMGWVVLHSLWQAGIIAIAVRLLLSSLRRGCAHLRYLLAVVALFLMVAIPLLTVSWSPSPKPTVSTTNTVQTPTVTKSLPKIIDRGSPGNFRLRISPETWRDKIAGTIEIALPFITYTWMMGVGFVLIWYLGGLLHIEHILRRAVSPVPSDLCDRVHIWARRLRVHHSIRVVQSTAFSVPTVAGIVKPVLFIPASMLTGLDRQALEAIIVHELVHIRRFDFLVNLGQMVVEILMFYHPAVWWLSGVIRQEREHCCDDQAALALGDEVRYVRSLVALEERRIGLNLAVAANSGDLFSRIRRLSRGHLPRRATRRSVSVFLVALCLMVFLGLGGVVWAHTVLTEQILFPELVGPVNLEYGLVAHYPLNGSGEDHSPHQNHGLVDGATPAPDRFGREGAALSFDGHDDRIIVAASDSLNIKGSITVSCWVQVHNYRPYRSWIAKANNGDIKSQWRIGLGQHPREEWGITQHTWIESDQRNFWQDYWITDCLLPLKKWVHTVVVVDQINSRVSMYHNGRHAGTIDHVSPFVVSDDPLYVGYQPDNLRHFEGMIDDVRIYRRPLSPREVRALYHER